jgi:hypothetical protein
MQATITNWKTASTLWLDFAKAYPELGYSGNQNSWLPFQRRHEQRLKAFGVIHQTGARNSMIAEVDRFECVAFDLLALGALPDESTAAAA